jgi:hypothetical protein
LRIWSLTALSVSQSPCQKNHAKYGTSVGDHAAVLMLHQSITVENMTILPIFRRIFRPDGRINQRAHSCTDVQVLSASGA